MVISDFKVFIVFVALGLPFPQVHLSVGGGGGGGGQQASSLSSKHKLWNFHRYSLVYIYIYNIFFRSPCFFAGVVCFPLALVHASHLTGVRRRQVHAEIDSGVLCKAAGAGLSFHGSVSRICGHLHWVRREKRGG